MSYLEWAYSSVSDIDINSGDTIVADSLKWTVYLVLVGTFLSNSRLAQVVDSPSHQASWCSELGPFTYRPASGARLWCSTGEATAAAASAALARRLRLTRTVGAVAAWA